MHQYIATQSIGARNGGVACQETDHELDTRQQDQDNELNTRQQDQHSPPGAGRYRPLTGDLRDPARRCTGIATCCTVICLTAAAESARAQSTVATWDINLRVEITRAEKGAYFVPSCCGKNQRQCSSCCTTPDIRTMVTYRSSLSSRRESIMDDSSTTTRSHLSLFFMCRFALPSMFNKGSRASRRVEGFHRLALSSVQSLGATAVECICH